MHTFLFYQSEVNIAEQANALAGAGHDNVELSSEVQNCFFAIHSFHYFRKSQGMTIQKTLLLDENVNGVSDPVANDTTSVRCQTNGCPPCEQPSKG